MESSGRAPERSSHGGAQGQGQGFVVSSNTVLPVAVAHRAGCHRECGSLVSKLHGWDTNIHQYFSNDDSVEVLLLLRLPLDA